MPPRKATRHRLLFFDLETAPLTAYIWGPKVEYVNHEQIIDDSFVLTWAAKWENSRKVMSGQVTPREAKNRNDRRIVGELTGLLREADMVVAHNADRFDIPVFNARLLAMKMPPTGPIQTIDTLKLARKNFRHASNRLDYLGKLLLREQKLKTDFSLWKGVLAGDEAAIRRMVRYNKKDVTLLERVLVEMRPYLTGLPRVYEASKSGEMVCTSCGGDRFIKRGFHRTKASTFQRWECKGCHQVVRERRSMADKLGVVPL